MVWEQEENQTWDHRCSQRLNHQPGRLQGINLGSPVDVTAVKIGLPVRGLRVEAGAVLNSFPGLWDSITHIRMYCQA